MVGLGNPGPRFDATRHNVGFAVVEAAARRLGVRLRKPLFARYRLGRTGGRPSERMVLAEPLTYMNRSGTVMPRLQARAQAGPAQTLVICDNLDLEPGRVRVKRGGGTAGHRGLASIVEVLGHGDFLRLYIGVGRPADGDVVAHVLGVPPAEEAGLYEEAVGRAVDAVLALRERPPQQVMNETNRRSS